MTNSIDQRILFAASSLSGLRAAENQADGRFGSVEISKLAFEDADAMLEAAELMPDFVAVAVENAKIDQLEGLIRSLKMVKARYEQMGDGQRWSTSAKAIQDVINTVQNNLSQLKES